MKVSIGYACVAAAVVFLTPAPVLASDGAAVDAEAAEALARRENCLKCHGVDKDKSGPSYKSIAAKYRRKGGGEEKLMKHVKSGEIVLVDGEEEEHRIIKSTDDDAIRNLIRWILSL